MPDGGAGSIRSTASRFSLNEQFAASRREFEFDLESEEGSFLEPAPIVEQDFPDDSDDDNDDDNADARSDVSEAEVLRWMDADEDGVDYYTLLGLPRDPPPTTTQIRAAHRRMSLAFHPDRHPQALKAMAERHFTRLQKAYETLVEPRKRTIYDLEGEEGVDREYSHGGAMAQGGEADTLEVGVKTLTAAEFKAWFIGIIRKRERKAIEALVGASGNIELSFNGIRLLIPQQFQVIDLEDGQQITLPLPKMDLMAFKVEHDFQVPLPQLEQAFQKSWNLLGELTGYVTPEDADENILEDQESWQQPIFENAPLFTLSAGVAGQMTEKLEAFSALSEIEGGES
jgi:DnaJ family protein C protein 11